MKRRDFVAWIGTAGFAWSLAVHAQQPRAVRIGFLSAAGGSDPVIDGFRQGLREAGYIEGKNLQIELRAARGDAHLLEQSAADLLKMNVEVIVTMASLAASAAKRATTRTPIVFTAVSDPVALGLVHNMARPEANVTGISGVRDEAVGKELESLKQAATSLRSVTLLTGPRSNPSTELNLKSTEVAARTLGLKSQIVEISDPSRIESSFADIERGHAHGIFLVPSPWLVTHRNPILELATKRRNPTVGWQSALAESGALLSYGASNFEIGRRAAAQVAKLLAGAKPADIPVEEPTAFELVVNLRTARALGLTIPKTVLGRADRVIE
jgi:putative tryptophan/tyrosine transport system substrate-binding protein